MVAVSADEAERGCKSGVAGDTSGASPPTLPWETNPRVNRPEAKTDVLKNACLLGPTATTPVPLRRVLDATFGATEAHDREDYQLVYRLAQSHPNLLAKSKPYGDLLWLTPSDEAVTLLRSRHDLKTQEGEASPEGDQIAALRQDALPQERAERILSSTRRIRSDRQRGTLLKLLAYHRGTTRTEDGERKRITVGTPGTASRCRVPASDRFTDTERATRPRTRYERACDALEDAADGWATWATYTLPRECIPSVYGSVEVVREGLRSLHARMGYDPADPAKPNRPGYVPPYLTALEPHSDLVAHLHVVYAGERRLMDVNDLRQDWAEVIDAPAWKPPRVHLATLSIEPERWQVTRSAGDGEILRSYGNIRDYHRESLRRLAQLAEMSHERLHERADALLAGEGTPQDRDLAGLALPWATEARFTTAADALKQAESG